MHALLNQPTNFQILLLQELWFGCIGTTQSDFNPSGQNINGTVSNPAWHCYLPCTPTTNRPCIVTYIWKSTTSIAIHANLMPNLLNSPDIMALNCKSYNSEFILINAYNGGTGRAATSVSTLMRIDIPTNIPVILCGDFNLHHPNWSLSYHTPRSRATSTDFTDWLSEQGLFILNDTSMPTRVGSPGQTDSIIDLTIGNTEALNVNLIQQWKCDPSLAFGSDHNGIQWTLGSASPVNPPQASSPHRHRIDINKQNEWCTTLKRLLDSNPPPTNYLTIADIDCGASLFTTAMSNATSQVMPKISGKPPLRAKWWNALTQEFLDIRKERDDIALRMDAVRQQHEEAETKRQSEEDLNAAIFDIELAVQRGKQKAEREDRQDEAPEMPLHWLLDDVAASVSTSGSGGGLL